MQPGATRIFCVKGATRLLPFSAGEKLTFAAVFLLKNPLIAPKGSKKAT
nr:hypothetical protein [uncultured Pseudomonas sp.]